MTIRDLARKYRISIAQVYQIMYALDTKQGVRWTKQGNRYALTPEEIRLLEKELEERYGNNTPG